MSITLWNASKTSDKSYRNLTLFTCSWWLCLPINIKFHGNVKSHFGFEFMPIGFNKYNQGWSFRLLALKLVWVG